MVESSCLPINKHHISSTVSNLSVMSVIVPCKSNYLFKNLYWALLFIQAQEAHYTKLHSVDISSLVLTRKHIYQYAASLPTMNLHCSLFNCPYSLMLVHSLMSSMHILPGLPCAPMPFMKVFHDVYNQILVWASAYMAKE